MKNNAHARMGSFIWNICNLLRGPYKRNEYRKVTLPLTVLRRFECALEKTKQKVVDMYGADRNKPAAFLERASGYPFYNTSEYTLKKFLNESDSLASNLKVYIEGFSANAQSIF